MMLRKEEADLYDSTGQASKLLLFRLCTLGEKGKPVAVTMRALMDFVAMGHCHSPAPSSCISLFFHALAHGHAWCLIWKALTPQPPPPKLQTSIPPHTCIVGIASYSLWSCNTGQKPPSFSCTRFVTSDDL